MGEHRRRFSHYMPEELESEKRKIYLDRRQGRYVKLYRL